MWNGTSVSEMRKLLHHKVEVKCSDNKSHIGWVYTVDPLTQSIVLYEEATEENKANLTMIFSHCIKDVTNLQKQCEEMDTILNKLCESGDESNNFSEEELEGRKSALKAWLERNRLPVKDEGGRLKIAESLDILPPFTRNSCQSKNEIILSRVQSIIDLMPDDCSEQT